MEKAWFRATHSTCQQGFCSSFVISIDSGEWQMVIMGARDRLPLWASHLCWCLCQAGHWLAPLCVPSIWPVAWQAIQSLMSAIWSLKDQRPFVNVNVWVLCQWYLVQLKSLAKGLGKHKKCACCVCAVSSQFNYRLKSFCLWNICSRSICSVIFLHFSWKKKKKKKKIHEKMWVTDPFSHVLYPDTVQLWHVLVGARMQSHHHSYLSARRRRIIKACISLSPRCIYCTLTLHLIKAERCSKDVRPWLSAMSVARLKITPEGHCFHMIPLNRVLISQFLNAPHAHM